MCDDKELTHADVERIVQIVDQAGFGYVQLESHGVTLRLERERFALARHEEDGFRSTSAQQEESKPTDVPLADVPGSSTSAIPSSEVPSSPGRPETRSSEDQTSGSLVTAPVLGIFYDTPDPESPPYVSVGQKIKAGTTVGLIEVMKMYTAVKSDVDGTVAEVIASHGQHVERGQALVRIVED